MNEEVGNPRELQLSFYLAIVTTMESSGASTTRLASKFWNIAQWNSENPL
jgi:hypothetical protein